MSRLVPFINFSGVAIISEPNDVAAPVGSSVCFSVSFYAQSPIFQWFDQYNRPIPYVCTDSIRFAPVRDEDFGFYRLQITDRVTNQSQSTRWIELKKRHSPHPAHTTDTEDLRPKAVSVPLGGAYYKGKRVSLTAHFERAGLYQWYKDDVKLEGRISNTLFIEEARPEDTGDYVVCATNNYGHATAKMRIIVG